LQELVQKFIDGMSTTTWFEYIAVFSGIVSVWYSRKEDILVYPTGLASTIIYIYLSFKNHLIGEASVNFYYTVMSLYGWMLWARKDKQQHPIVNIDYSTTKQWGQQILFFVFFYVAIFFALTFLKQKFYPGAIPWADALASGSAFTGMWLMAKKKVESWYWWVFTNFCSVPLYFVKGLVFTSVYYVVLLIMAFWGLIEWRRRATANKKKILKKVVIIGPESTGKSTLCQQLASHFHALWCPEYAREYLLENGKHYTYDDLLTIAKCQVAMERNYTQLSKHNSLLFIDTDMYVMKVWCEFVFGQCHKFILNEITRSKYDLYLLCNTDLPWEKDELREYPDLEIREKLFTIYKEILINQSVPWVEIKGRDEHRLQMAIDAVNSL
jgi:nicotinamide mononucleotide transporter